MSITKQIEPRMWLGRVQVQISNSSLYTNLVYTGMSMLTFWYTAGHQIQARYVPWLNLWEFVIGLLLLLWVVIPYLDYKFALSSRQAFQNQQACEHKNPAMDILNELKDDMAKVKAKLEIQ